eukprot:197073-Rhodomonas_salina.1
MDQDMAGLKKQMVGAGAVNSAILRAAPADGHQAIDMTLLDINGHRVVGPDGKDTVVEIQVRMVEPELTAPTPTPTAAAVPPADTAPRDVPASTPAKKPKRKVELTVVSATHLPKMDMVGLCDPFVVLKYGGKEAKTTIKKKTLDATFNESFVLNLVPETANGDLDIKCMDHDMGLTDDVVGFAKVDAAVLRNAPTAKPGQSIVLNLHDA